MFVVFRTDASLNIGTGHVMRCLTLADALHEKGADCLFICREQPGSLLELIRQRGFKAHALPTARRNVTVGEPPSESHSSHETIPPIASAVDAEQTLALLGGASVDWLVVDHYGLGLEWEQVMRASEALVLVIDDLADRHHDCDLLLDQNFVEDLGGRYDRLVPGRTRQLLGPRYALLRREFLDVANRTRRSELGGVLRFFVFFGGTDPTGETAKALRSLDQLENAVRADVVVGAGNPQRSEIEAWCRARTGLDFHCQIDNMATLMSEADLALGAGGATTWERCFLGLPALVVSVAANQVDVTRAVARAGAQIDLGWHEQVDEFSFLGEIRRLSSTPHLLGVMSEAGIGLVSGNGFRGAAGVVSAMMQ